MCDYCVPFADLDGYQIDDQVSRLAATFTGLPTVIGAPLLMGEESWAEVARHQVELGVRMCDDIPAIKTYTAPSPEEAMDAQRAAGRWAYLPEYQDTETPRERIVRMAREQREAYLVEVQRRRDAGELPPA